MKGESGGVTVPHRTRDAPRTLSFVYAHPEAGQLGRFITGLRHWVNSLSNTYSHLHSPQCRSPRGSSLVHRNNHRWSTGTLQDRRDSQLMAAGAKISRTPRLGV